MQQMKQVQQTFVLHGFALNALRVTAIHSLRTEPNSIIPRVIRRRNRRSTRFLQSDVA